MNLRELLLQFAGENERSLQIEELLCNKISGIEIEEDLTNGVKILIENPVKVEAIKKAIKNVLDNEGYEGYKIIPQSDGEIQHLIIEVD